MKSLLIPPLLWGLAGGFSHCIGMCGIFVLACTNLADTSDGNRHSNTIGQVLFQAGRLVALVLLGAAAGALGTLTGFREHIPGMQGYLAVSAGAVLAIFSLGQFGLVPALRIPEPNLMTMFGGQFRRIYTRLLCNRTALKPLALGFVVGLLPCGLTYYVLIYVLGCLGPIGGAAAMAMFTLGTSVGLMTFGLAVGSAKVLVRSDRLRATIARSSGAIMLAMAGILIIRGWTILHAL